MEIKIDEKDRDKIVSEIADCQSRIIQVLVPTVIAVGLISIADRENFALITLVTSFAILFSASIYIASLSYKVFRNAMFLRVMSEYEEKQNSDIIQWEKALSLFTQKTKPPFIIGYETKTVAVVFIVFALSFVIMFYDMNATLSLFLGTVLLGVSVSMYFIPQYCSKYYETWKEVIQSYM